jgi:hypothetical protein
MPTDWVKMGTGIVAGGVAGGVDQLVQNRDDKEEDRRHKLATTAPGFLKPEEKLPMTARIGTYYNYGAPLVAVGAVAMGALKGDTALMALTAGGQLAGRQLTHSMTVKARPIVAGWQVRERGTPAPPLPPPGTGSRLEF